MGPQASLPRGWGGRGGGLVKLAGVAGRVLGTASSFKPPGDRAPEVPWMTAVSSPCVITAASTCQVRVLWGPG